MMKISFEQLKAELQSVKNDVQHKESEIFILQDQIFDLTAAQREMAEITYIVSLMLEENLEFIKAKGLTEKAKISRERLLKLIFSTENFNTIASQNQTLKLHNRELLTKNQLLRVEIKLLKDQINRTEKAFNEL